MSSHKLLEVLTNKETCYNFKRYLKHIFAGESLEFYMEVELFKRVEEVEMMFEEAYRIYYKFFYPHSEYEINIDGGIKDKLKSVIEAGEIDNGIFDEAGRSVYALLENNCLPIFLKSAYCTTPKKPPSGILKSLSGLLHKPKQIEECRQNYHTNSGNIPNNTNDKRKVRAASVTTELYFQLIEKSPDSTAHSNHWLFPSMKARSHIDVPSSPSLPSSPTLPFTPPIPLSSSAPPASSPFSVRHASTEFPSQSLPSSPTLQSPLLSVLSSRSDGNYQTQQGHVFLRTPPSSPDSRTRTSMMNQHRKLRLLGSLTEDEGECAL